MDTTVRLAEIELNAVNHFRVNFYAAVFQLVDHVRRTGHDGSLEETLNRHPFLASYLEAAAPLLPDQLSWEETRRWWQREIVAWEDSPDAPHLPLRALRTTAGIDFVARMALLTAGMVEQDSRFGAVITGFGSGHIGRPTLELVGAVVGQDPVQEASITWSIGRTLVDGALVDVINPADPRSEWVLRVRPELWDVLQGGDSPPLPEWMSHRPMSEAEDVAGLLLPAEFAARVGNVAPLLESAQVESVVVRGLQSAERLEVVASIARALGLGTVHVDAARIPENAWPRVGPMCAALGAMPVVEFDLAPGESVELRPLVANDGPIGVIVGMAGGLRGPAVENSVTLELPPARALDRQRQWERALNGYSVVGLADIAERFHLEAGHINRAASAAIAMAALDEREAVTLQDVQAATRTLNRQMLDTLAARLDPEGSWDLLVVGDFTHGKLAELEARCRHREQLLDHLGPAFGSATSPGVRALFTGSSGTGKTLAAKILGAQIGLDVYRVDLAAIVNKYVGETEKNLHRVLSTAEELDVLLLIDEGDALLGSRTEVKSANDRFANLETNYLLQRLESYRGIVVVTTNAPENIDSAFQRRMDVVVSFVAPAPQERFEIWRLHLPADHTVSASLIEEVSQRCAMTGGQIRNAALHAALLALSDGGAMRSHHLEQAVATEYQKAGAVSPFDPSGRRGRSSPAQVFLEVLP